MSSKTHIRLKTKANHKWKLLMAFISILLLVGFLLVWLIQQYNLQESSLQKEINSKFAESMRDVTEQQMHQLLSEKLGKDSVILDSLKMTFHPPRGNRMRFLRQERSSRQKPISRDTLVMGLDSSKEKILIQATTAFPEQFTQDSAKGRTFSAISVRQKDGLKFFSIQDSFELDAGLLDSTFSMAVLAAGIDLSVYVNQSEFRDSFPESVLDTLVTSWHPGGSPVDTYYAGIAPDTRWYLIQKISPLIIFSLFLTGLIVLALWMMYRSIIQIERLNLIKSELVSNMSHELKTPVATVGVAIEALQHFQALQDPQKTADYLKIARSELDRLSLLIEKVMQFSMIDQGQMKLESSPVDLNLLALEAERCISIQIAEKGGVIETKLSTETLIVEGDQTHLLHVLINLIDNGIKYNHQVPHIQVEVTRDEKSAILKISDNGPGIDPAYHSKIFERFFRVPNGDRHNIKGHGLGLSYVKEVVQMHKGTIQIQSSEGKGSTFIINLPLTDYDSQ
jgi:signal transduction histidine kinase